MAITDSETMLSLANYIGSAWTNLSGTIDTDNSSSAISKTAAARGLVTTDETDADFVSATELATFLHNLTTSLPSSINQIFAKIPDALNTYVELVLGTSFRATYVNLDWNSGFTSLWRTMENVELIVNLGSVTNTTGTWGSYVSNATIVLDSLIQVTATTIGSSGAVVTINGTNAAGSQSTTVTIPSSTSNGTVFDVPTPKFSVITSVTVSGGNSGDVYSLWVI